MEGSLSRETVEENLQKIGVLGYGSVVRTAGFEPPVCKRGQLCRMTVTTTTLLFKQPVSADVMNCRGRELTETST